MNPQSAFSDDWKSYKLSEIITLIGGGTPKTTNTDYWGGEIPWLSVKDFNNDFRYVYKTEKTITQLGLEQSSTTLLQKDDIIISARGTVGETAMIPYPMAFNQSCYGIRAKRDLVDSIFLYYLLKTSIKILKNNAHGSVFDTITRDTFDGISIDLPPLPVQKKIAAILSSLDDKIELNTRMNNILEEIARALFDRWFVEFEFPDAEGMPYKSSGGKMVASEMGSVPEGWKVTKLKNHVEVMRGFSYKGSGLSNGSGVPMYNLNSVLEGGGYKYLGIKHYTGEVKDKFQINEGEIVVANTEQGHKYLLIGYPAIIPKYAEGGGIFSHHLYRLRLLPESPCKKYYLYYLLLSSSVREQIIGCTNGTTVNMLSIDGLKRPEFILPSSEIIQKYDEISCRLLHLVEKNYHESKILKNTRDKLLPKLMNGDIEV